MAWIVRTYMLRKPFVSVLIRFRVKAQYAAQTVCVGSHSFPGEGAASGGTGMKMNREDTVKHEEARRKNRKICVICVICGPLFFSSSLDKARIMRN